MGSWPGSPPGSAPVRALARETQQRLSAFASGDPGTLRDLGVIRRDAPPVQLAGWDPPLFRYLDLALQALDSQEKPPC